MSNQNYTKYSEKSKNTEPEVIDEVVETTVTEPEVKATVEPPTEPVYGLVTNCMKLNIRKNPNIRGEVVTIVKASTKLTIDTEKSTRGWYHVYTNGGLEGFCMKEYITIE